MNSAIHLFGRRSGTLVCLLFSEINGNFRKMARKFTKSSDILAISQNFRLELSVSCRFQLSLFTRLLAILSVFYNNLSDFHAF